MAEKSMADAVLKSLADFDVPMGIKDLYENAVAKKYLNLADFGKTPFNSLSACLTNFVQKGDTRIKRIKAENGKYAYYLTNKETQLIFPDGNSAAEEIISEAKPEKPTFYERDLHKLFVSYLRNERIYAKTIYHENSTGKEKNQRWTHPDIVGVKFLDLEKSANDFLKLINLIDAFDIYSYELKTEIKNDTDLKEKYFQAVSNSSWANYGYLVAVEIESDLLDELKRLNQSFGIGFIKLSVKNPFETKIICQAQYKSLDFNTISKLCKQNLGFVEFIDKIRDVVKADERYHKSILIDFEQNTCDKYFGVNEDENIEKYCVEKNIFIDDEEAE